MSHKRPRSFPRQQHHVLGSFAVPVSIPSPQCWSHRGSASWNIHLNHSSQATLYPVHPNTGSFPSRSSLPDQKKFPTVKGLHGSWVRPHAIEDSPSTLTPSISPKLGVRSQHQKLHRYALNGFLAPSSNKDLLTRIPHHLFTYILYSFYSFFASAHNKKPV